MSECTVCKQEIHMGQTIDWVYGKKAHKRCTLPDVVRPDTHIARRCTACGCRVYFTELVTPRFGGCAHILCSDELDRLDQLTRIRQEWCVTDMSQSFHSHPDPDFIAILTRLPATDLSGEWKDFWLECRKRDRAEIDKARGESPRAVSIIPADSDEEV